MGGVHAYVFRISRGENLEQSHTVRNGRTTECYLEYTGIFGVLATRTLCATSIGPFPSEPPEVAFSKLKIVAGEQHRNGVRSWSRRESWRWCRLVFGFKRVTC